MTTPRLEFLDPSQLDDHPANWKFHPPEQLSSLKELIDELGWLHPLVYNARTARLLDGHGRKALFAEKGLVPVYVVDLDPELEPRALATLDTIGRAAFPDPRKFDHLLKAGKLLESSRGATLELLKAVRKAAGPADAPEARRADEEHVDIPLDSLFPSANPWGVPDLDPELQADGVPMPVRNWGSEAQTKFFGGTWHFYVDDYKFEPLWRRPHRVFLSRPAACVEPNFSTTPDQPLACSLWHIYRKRWLGRYWQSRGIRVFVDTNVDPVVLAPRPEFGGHRPALLGVPRGWKSYASRAHAHNPGSLSHEWDIIQEHASPQRPTFLVVGGGRDVQALAHKEGWIWTPEPVQLAHRQDAGLAG